MKEKLVNNIVCRKWKKSWLTSIANQGKGEQARKTTKQINECYAGSIRSEARAKGTCCIYIIFGFFLIQGVPWRHTSFQPIVSQPFSMSLFIFFRNLHQINKYYVILFFKNVGEAFFITVRSTLWTCWLIIVI